MEASGAKMNVGGGGASKEGSAVMNSGGGAYAGDEGAN